MAEADNAALEIVIMSHLRFKINHSYVLLFVGKLCSDIKKAGETVPSLFY